MRQFYEYLLFGPSLRRARFLLAPLFLMTLISIFGTTSGVFAQSPAEDCRETEKVLRQYEREATELEREEYFKVFELRLRRTLSDLDEAIATGGLIDMDLLMGYSRRLNVQLPKHPITGQEKQPGQLTVQERRTLQRTFRSALERKLQEAANTPWDRLEDRRAKNTYQIQIRLQRMKDLNCPQVLKDGRVEGKDGTSSTGDAACWNGTFTGIDTGRHKMTINLTQGANGKVTGGWNFNQSGTQVNATITEATVKGNSLEGKWTQTGVVMSGSFVWTWLPEQTCKAFEGSFNGTKYWYEMAK